MLAALLSGVAARIAYMSYRVSGPRLRLALLRKEMDLATRRVVVTFTVINEGRADRSVFKGSKLFPTAGPSLPAADSYGRLRASPFRAAENVLPSRARSARDNQSPVTELAITGLWNLRQVGSVPDLPAVG